MIDLPLEALASVNARGHNSPHLGTVEAWFRAFLATLAPGETITSRGLIERFGISDDDQLTKKRLMQSLWHLRRLGKIGDCFTTDPEKVWYGHPLILYRNPIREGIF